MLNRLRQLFPTNTLQYREQTSQRITWGHWFALFNIVVAILIASRYAFNADWPNTLVGKLYFLSAFSDISASLFLPFIYSAFSHLVF